MFKVKTWDRRKVSMAAVLLSIGCARQLDVPPNGSETQVKGRQIPQDIRTVYPVSPGVHEEGPNHGNIGGQPAPRILNAVAYARYAAEINGSNEIGRVEEIGVIAEALTQQAEASGIPFELAIKFEETKAPTGAYEEYAHEVESDARNVVNPGQLSRQAREVVDGRARLAACQADGFDALSCCQSLVWTSAIIDSNEAEVSYRAHMQSVLQEQRLEVQTGGRASVQPFSQSGIRTWLAYCGGVVSDAPLTLWDFKYRFGDYHSHGEWTTELHPISPAKQAGRRIYRRVLNDGTWVSVAESTDDDCRVRETETIVMRPGAQAVFWVFDRAGDRVEHAYFPTRRPGEDTVRFAPNACMGCHYTMDTRRFNVPAPSFESLNLKFFESDTGTVWRDHSHCARDGETLIYHDAPVLGRSR